MSQTVQVVVFVFGGSQIEEDNIKKICEYFKKEISEYSCHDMIDEVEDDLRELNLKIICNNNNNDFWIGREFSSIGDNETGNQFKESIKNSLNKILGEKINCHTIEESWYN